MPSYPLSKRTHPYGTKIWVRYQHEWPSVDISLDASAAKIAIELEAFKLGLKEEDGGCGVYQHFRNICEDFWPSFEWHRWSEWQAKRICETRMTGFTGAASTAKSTIMVLYALACYIADPQNTMVMILTTSIKDAETRIWKEFSERYNEVRQRGLTGFRISNHEHVIRLNDINAARGNSIQLVAAGDKDRDNALQKLQGAKSKDGRVLIEIDEGQDVSDSVYRAITNLANNPKLEVKCAGNAAFRLDTHGQFCTPVGGWGTVDENSKEWPIEIEGIPGVCLHLDGFDSPNFDDRSDITRNDSGQPIFDNYDPTIPDRYPYIKRTDRVKAELEGKGVKDPDFWRQCRGFWPPSDVDVNTIYPQGDLFQYGAMEMNVSWLFPPINILSVDPAKGGGDRFIVDHIKWGQGSVDEKERDYPFLYLYNQHELKIEGSTDEESYHLAMVKKVMGLANDLGIPPFNVAVDATSLDAIGSLFHAIWSREILLVDFNGKPTEKLLMDELDREGKPKKCSEFFDRRVSELWFIGRKFMLKRQIAGLRQDVAKELSGRQYQDKAGKKVVETKDSYRERHKGASPDLGDSLMIGLDLLRERFGAVPGINKTQRNPWADIFPVNSIDKPKPLEIKTLHTAPQFRTPNEPKGHKGGELYRWLHATHKK